MNWTDPKSYLKKFELSEFPQPDIIQLKYPVLLCHGYGGFSMLISASPMHKSCMHLREHGIHSFAPNIVPYATIDIRANQWIDVIKKLKKKYGYTKFNVVAHSMAGLDIRYAITHLNIDSEIASLTSIASPHHGTSLAETVLTAPEAMRDKLGELADWVGENIYPSQKSDSVAAVKQLTRDYVNQVFNPETPDIEGIQYFSYSAAVGKGTKSPLNAFYKVQNQIIYQNEGLNDAFVTVESAKWGIHLKTLDLSHLEQIYIQVSKERKPKVDAFWLDLIMNLKKNDL